MKTYSLQNYYTPISNQKLRSTQDREGDDGEEVEVPSLSQPCYECYLFTSAGECIMFVMFSTLDRVRNTAGRCFDFTEKSRGCRPCTAREIFGTIY